MAWGALASSLCNSIIRYFFINIDSRGRFRPAPSFNKGMTSELVTHCHRRAAICSAFVGRPRRRGAGCSDVAAEAEVPGACF